MTLTTPPAAASPGIDPAAWAASTSHSSVAVTKTHSVASLRLKPRQPHCHLQATAAAARRATVGVTATPNSSSESGVWSPREKGRAARPAANWIRGEGGQSLNRDTDCSMTAPVNPSHWSHNSLNRASDHHRLRARGQP